MSNARKNLKYMSIVILALTVFTLIRVLLDVFSLEIDADAVADGVTAGLVLFAQIFVCAFSLILLLPQVYVGVKGLKISKTPDSSRAHIVWATILAVLSALGILSPISAMVQTGDFANNFAALLDAATDAAVYIAYVGFAKQVLKEA